jgi:hypothetical protein
MLVDLVQAKRPGPLRLAAVHALLLGSHEAGEGFAQAYLANVAAGREAGGQEPADAATPLTEEQLRMLRALAARNPEAGTEAAVALLMRAAENQRDALQAYIKLPTSDHPRVAKIRELFGEGDADDLRNEILRAVLARTSLRALLALMAQAVHDHGDEARLRAVLLYALAKNARLQLPYLWRLTDMLGHGDTAVRREAADRLQRIGAEAAPVLEQLQAAHEAEDSAPVRASLAKAIQNITGEAPGKDDDQGKTASRQPPRRTPTKRPRRTLRPKTPPRKAGTPNVYQRNYNW